MSPSRPILAFAVALVLASPVVVAAQACVGSPVTRGHAAVRIGIGGVETIRSFSDQTSETDIELGLSGQLPQRVWAEAGFGYRRTNAINNDAARVAATAGYSFEVGDESFTICPMAMFEYESDDLVGEPETVPVERSTTRMAGVGIGKRFAIGEHLRLNPFVAALGGRFNPRYRVASGWVDGSGVGTTYFDVGITLQYRRGFVFHRGRLIGSGDAIGSTSLLGVGLTF